jgi:hypothetical protein
MKSYDISHFLNYLKQLAGISILGFNLPMIRIIVDN